MVTIGESRVLLAKSRRLLVSSKRLLRDLEDRRLSLNSAEPTAEAAAENPSDRPQTRTIDADFDENSNYSAEGQHVQIADAVPRSRSRHPC